MTHPHPTDVDFAAAYSRAWTSQPVELLDFFAPDGSYTDVARGATYHGRDEIARFHRSMLKFAPDSVIEFSDPAQPMGGCTSNGFGAERSKERCGCLMGRRWKQPGRSSVSLESPRVATRPMAGC
jgi:hypothetical protein